MRGLRVSGLVFNVITRAYADHTIDRRGFYSYKEPAKLPDIYEYEPSDTDSSGSKPESAFDNTRIQRAAVTDEERMARMNELLVLINEEEKALLP